MINSFTQYSLRLCSLSLLLVGLAVSLAGAQTGSPLQEPQPQAPLVYKEVQAETFWPDNDLKQLFGHYWHLRFEGLSEQSWPLEALFFQEMVPAARYHAFVQGGKSNTLLAVEIQGLEHLSAYCVTIACVLRFKMKNGELKETFTKDRWVFSGEKWRHVLRNPVIFPAAG
jgi:hypothetical protein